MPLIPYEPFRHMENMRREMERFFQKGWQGLDFGHDSPRVDVYETENEVVARCDLPGLERKEDVNIDIDRNILSISGKINREDEVREEQIYKKERYLGRFQRTISLPSVVSQEGVKATYKNGVLEIRMPKIKNENRKQIDIEFH